MVPSGKKTVKEKDVPPSLPPPPIFFLASSYELLFANTVFDREEMKEMCAMG